MNPLAVRVRSGIGLFLVLLAAAFFALGARVFDLQFHQRQQYDETSRMQRLATVRQLPQRGLIVDCKGQILAASNRIYSLFAEPRQLQDPDQCKITASMIQDVLNLPAHELTGLIHQARNPGYLNIYSDLNPQQRQALVEARIPGAGVQESWKRYYPAQRLTSHLIGFIGKDQYGLAGLELQYDSVLKGDEGKEVYVVDVARRPLAAAISENKQVFDGNSLVLTIDKAIQQFTYAAVKKQMESYEAESAVGLVMDPWTGAILAMVSFPDYAPSDFSRSNSDQLRNRILTDPYEPGSIFKPIVAALALDAGVITITEKIDCENGYWDKFRIGEFGNHQYGMMMVSEIIAESSNIGMAKIGLKMTKKQLHDGLVLFGFGKKTGVDLPGEDSGIVHPVSRWSSYSPTRIAFGHEVLVTALQIAQGYCILANGGSLVCPHLVKAVVQPDGTLSEITPSLEGIGFILKPETAHWMVQEALTAVVNEGTGDKAQIDEVQVFGKTGTANIALPTGGYDTSNYVASFVGGAPAEHPRLIVLVSIRKPNRSLGKGYSGGRVTAPVAREILSNSLRYLGEI